MTILRPTIKWCLKNERQRIWTIPEMRCASPIISQLSNATLHQLPILQKLGLFAARTPQKQVILSFLLFVYEPIRVDYQPWELPPCRPLSDPP
jgi:hypothetical protein